MLSLLLFLLTVIAISLSGVMMPGPVFLVTLAKGYESPFAGVWVALGHGIVEFPLIAIIYFGFARFFQVEPVKTILSVVGGSILIYMGWYTFRTHLEITKKVKSLSRRSVTGGFLTTVSNPYFFLWWTTIGAVLMTRAIRFGLAAILLFVLVHWLCDLAWCSLVSFTVYKSKRLWTEKLHTILFRFSGGILVGFGSWFIFTGVV